jgi:RNA polymerase sigma-70 factor (ECF subfamily)
MESSDLEPDDRQLLCRIRNGEKAAFHELVDGHAASLFGLAYSMTGNAADAEDIVQETLTGAFRGMKAFRGQSSLKTWLTQILVRQVAAHRRGRRRFLDFLRVRGSRAGSSVSPASPSADARMDVTAAILALADEHRQVIVLRELRGLSYEEIAEALGVPRGTVESRLFRARRAMRELLGEYMA